MDKLATPPFRSAVLVCAVFLGACSDDIETIPPSYDAGAANVASNSGSMGGSSGGTSPPVSGGTGGALATGGTGGASASGGTTASAGGTLGSGGSEAGASGGSGGATLGGETGAGTGPGGRGAAGFGSGGRTGTAGRGGAGGAAAGGGGAAGSGTSTFAAVGAVVQMTCADADCHGGKERPSLLSTNLGTLYNTLKNTAVRQCGNDRLATANDPANSALLELVQHQCGMFVMPEDCTENPCIDADAVATITTWIQAGAPAP